jgi:hypothetical protein
MKAFQIDFRPLETEFGKLQKEQKQERLIEDKKAEEWEAQKKELAKKFEKEKIQAVAQILDKMDEQTVSDMREEFLTEMKRNPLFSKILETKGLESAPIQTQWINFIAQHHLPKTAYEFDEFLKSGGYDTTDWKISGEKA